ncbi:MAG: hypothetical protein ACE5IB_01250 [Candidatus Geothermarchaeales archaeon]
MTRDPRSRLRWVAAIAVAGLVAVGWILFSLTQRGVSLPPAVRYVGGPLAIAFGVLLVFYLIKPRRF